MAGKKKAAVVVEAVKEMSTAEKLKAAYAELDVMNVAVQAEMQKAYRFARDNNLVYSAPFVVRDSDDLDNESWDSSYC